jgi:hypothetical protein
VLAISEVTYKKSLCKAQILSSILHCCIFIREPNLITKINNKIIVILKTPMGASIEKAHRSACPLPKADPPQLMGDKSLFIFYCSKILADAA